MIQGRKVGPAAMSTESQFRPVAPDFAERVRASFARQPFMTLLGAELTRVGPGETEIRLPFRRELTQQHGFLHAGVVTTIVDNACGYAALSLMPADAAVLTVEFKVNLLSPAQGDYLLARGTVVKAGQTLTVCSGEVHGLSPAGPKLVATMLATMMAVRGRTAVPPG